MLGTLIYVCLDVAFNILYWIIKKSYYGATMVFYYIYQNEEDQKIEITTNDINTIKKQLDLQNKMIIELKNNNLSK